MIHQLSYLPISPSFFAVLVVLFVVLFGLIQIGILRYAYMRLGVSSYGALLLLLGSLIGSTINIPLVRLAAEPILTGREVDVFGMRYIVPAVVDWPGTVLAVNVGGALIPALMSLYLLSRNRIWGPGLLATACVTALCHALAQPVAGVGIALPMLIPAAGAAVVSLLISPGDAAPMAYVSGSLGVLIGADLLNLDRIQGLGAPVASIGGAGTFDGIFLTSIVAVLIASLPGVFRRRPGNAGEPR